MRYLQTLHCAVFVYEMLQGKTRAVLSTTCWWRQSSNRDFKSMEETINGNISNLDGNSQLEVKEHHIIVNMYKVKMKVINLTQNGPGVPST